MAHPYDQGRYLCDQWFVHCRICRVQIVCTRTGFCTGCEVKERVLVDGVWMSWCRRQGHYVPLELKLTGDGVIHGSCNHCENRTPYVPVIQNLPPPHNALVLPVDLNFYHGFVQKRFNLCHFAPGMIHPPPAVHEAQNEGDAAEMVDLNQGAEEAVGEDEVEPEPEIGGAEAQQQVLAAQQGQDLAQNEGDAAEIVPVVDLQALNQGAVEEEAKIAVGEDEPVTYICGGCGMENTLIRQCRECGYTILYKKRTRCIVEYIAR